MMNFLPGDYFSVGTVTIFGHGEVVLNHLLYVSVTPASCMI